MKICGWCNQQFEKPSNLNMAAYLRRRFCGRSCSNSASNKGRAGLPSEYPREHRIWCGMIERCHKPEYGKSYEHYGGRGIAVCDRWRNSFGSFIEDMGKCPPLHSIDRMDNDGNYEPGNCRWLSAQGQGRNKRTNVLLSLNGKTQTLSEWSEQAGLSHQLIRHRMRSGWTTEAALTVPASKSQNHRHTGRQKYLVPDTLA